MIRVFGNVMVNLIIGSQILKAFCAIFGICARKKLYPEDFLMNTASNSSVERRVVNGRNCKASMCIYLYNSACPLIFFIVLDYTKL